MRSRLRAVCCSVCLLELWAIFVAGAKRFGTFGGSDPRFVWQAQDIKHLLIRVARARSISCTLLKRWQAWVKMRGAARGDLSHVVNLTAVFNFSKLLFRETVVTFGLAMLRCNTSDASASFYFFVASAVLFPKASHQRKRQLWGPMLLRTSSLVVVARCKFW